MIHSYNSQSPLHIKVLYFLILSFWMMNGTTALAGNTGTIDQANDPIGYQLCKVVKVLSGSVAKAVAVVALMSVGIGLFMGKVNWGVALTTATGVVVIFGASSIVGFLGGANADASACSSVS